MDIWVSMDIWVMDMWMMVMVMVMDGDGDGADGADGEED